MLADVDMWGQVLYHHHREKAPEEVAKHRKDLAGIPFIPVSLRDTPPARFLT